MILVAIGSVADAMMPIFVGMLVGMLSMTPPGQMFAQHWQTLLWMVVVLAGIRPVTFVLDAIVRNHAIVPSIVNLGALAKPLARGGGRAGPSSRTISPAGSQTR